MPVLSKEVLTELNTVRSALLNLDDVEFNLVLAKTLEDRAALVLTEKEDESLQKGIDDISKGNYITVSNKKEIKNILKEAQKKYVQA